MIMLSLPKIQSFRDRHTQLLDLTLEKAKSNQTLTCGLNGNNKIWDNAPIKTYRGRRQKQWQVKCHELKYNFPHFTDICLNTLNVKALWKLLWIEGNRECQLERNGLKDNGRNWQRYLNRDISTVNHYLEINLKKEQFPCKKNWFELYVLLWLCVRRCQGLLLGGRLPTPSPKCTVRISATET